MGAAFSFNREDAARIVIVHEVSRADMRRIDSEQLTSAIRTAVWDAHELQLDVVVLVRPATIPKTTSGKIQRGECRARFLSGALEELGRWERGTTMEAPLSHFPTSPRSDIEAWSIAWIARQKGIDSSEIHPDIPFADLGISSVEAVAFATAFFEHIGREDSRDTLLWEYPTIRGLSDAFTRPFERSPHAPPEPAINTPDLPLEDLSEDELRRLLFAELQELRANRGQ